MEIIPSQGEISRKKQKFVNRCHCNAEIMCDRTSEDCKRGRCVWYVPKNLYEKSIQDYIKNKRANGVLHGK